VNLADGRRSIIAAGSHLETFARGNSGEPLPYPDRPHAERRHAARRRVAEAAS
jgi:hypothetical protein